MPFQENEVLGWLTLELWRVQITNSRAMLGRDLTRCGRGVAKGKDSGIYHSHEERNQPMQIAPVGWHRRTRNHGINVVGPCSRTGGVRDQCKGRCDLVESPLHLWCHWDNASQGGAT